MPIAKPIKAILMDARTLQFRRFQFNPEPLDESIQVAYQEITAPGLSHPFFQYVGGNSDEITFEIHLNDAGEHLGYTEDFMAFLDRFRPRRNTQFSPPPPVILSYGPYQKTGIVTSMKISRERFDSRSLRTTKATISLSIKTLPV